MYVDSEDSKPSKHGPYSAKVRRNAKRALRQRADLMTYGEYSPIHLFAAASLRCVFLTR